MHHRKILNQNGFTALETILLIVIAAIIGGTGYYVYHANKKSDDTLKTSSGGTDGRGGGETGDSHAQTGTAKTESYIIPEWHVTSDFPAPPESAALIQYQITNGTPVSAAFTTQELIDADPACSASAAPAGIISRAAPTDPFYLEDGTPSGQTVQQQLTGKDNSFKPFKKAGDYYYWYTQPQAPCGDVSKTKNLQTVAEAQVKQIVAHLEVAQ